MQFLFIWEDAFYLDSSLYKTTHTGVLAGVNYCVFNETKK